MNTKYFNLNYYRDIMKLTAQFAARNGRAFISLISKRESKNYQFDFLRSNHSLFPYFTELVKQYTRVFLPPKDLQEKLKANTNDKYHILDRVKERVEWVRWQEAEKQKKNEEDEKERRMPHFQRHLFIPIYTNFNLFFSLS